MPSPQKRKTSPEVETSQDEPAKRRLIENDDSTSAAGGTTTLPVNDEASGTAPESDGSASASPAPANDRMARFKALQARANASRNSNLKATADERKRQAAPTAALPGLTRKHAKASEKLLRADVEASGEDFERKRAWDWTVEESEAWDRRLAKKERHRQGVAFADYGSEARKSYKRQLRDAAPPDLDEYAREKMAAVEKAAAAGGLEIVENEDGELIAIDAEGRVVGDDQSNDFMSHKPAKERVDRLVAEMKKDEAAQLKKRRDRGRGGDDGDVTYINEKNKQFNEKLARFYNKYTGDIRESFERGTAI
jgi:pre-mRNA-splicing factor SYF2